MKEVYILTKNPGKILAAQSIFSKFDIMVKNIGKDYPEIQAETSIEVAKNMALQATKEFKVPVIREDHSICLNALNHLPGPFISWFDKKISAEQLINLLKNATDRDGYFELAAAYAKPNGKIKKYVYRVPITIAPKPHGKRGNWERVIIIKDRPMKTIGESEEKDNIDLWNKNYIRIAEEISKE